MKTDFEPALPAERTIELTRELHAPVALVWAALTDPAHLANWWGPSGFVTETHAYDLRPGGAWRLTMHGPDGRGYASHAVFEAIEAPHRLALRYVSDADTEPALHTTTITLEALAPRHTRLTLCLVFPSAEARAEAADRYGAVAGGQQTLGRLATLLDTLQGGQPAAESLVLRRVLAAPQALVWAAWTDAKHLHRWFHPEVWQIFSCDLDLRVGGTFFYGMRGPNVPEMWALWRFTEVDAPRRLAFVLAFADAHRTVIDSPFGGPWPRDLATTVTLEPHAGIGGGTLLTVTSTPLDATDAERAAFGDAFGPMEAGWGQTLDSLAGFLRSQTPG